MANILYRGTAIPAATNPTTTFNSGPLTNDQIDKNFYALNTDKLDKATTTAQTITSDVTFSGNVTINGTTTTVSATDLVIADKNIELGKVAIPTDTTANGGGITLKGATDKTILWDSTNSNWTSSENLNIATGKVFKIANTSVLSATVLGSGVTSSSLTKIGALSSGAAGFVKVDASGNLAADTTAYLSGTVPIVSGGTNITTYAAGDILYASAANVLSKLAKGSDGQVLKLTSGLPAWGTDTDTTYYVSTNQSITIDSTIN